MWFGAWFGLVEGTAPEPETPPTPVPVPVSFGSEEYVGHAAAAIDRLPEQFRGDPDDEET